MEEVDLDSPYSFEAKPKKPQSEAWTSNQEFFPNEAKERRRLAYDYNCPLSETYAAFV